MTARIGTMLALPAKQEVMQLTSFWMGRKLFVKVQAPDVIPPESRYSNWATILADTVPADGYMVLDDNVEAACALQKATGKPAIVRVLLGGKSEKSLEVLRDEGLSSGVSGFFFAMGQSQAGASIEQALAIFRRSELNPVLGTSVVMPSRFVSQDAACVSLAKRIHFGCSLVVLSPWIDPAESSAFFSQFSERFGALPAAVYQGVCPLHEPSQWGQLRHSGLNISPKVGSALDKAIYLPDFSDKSIALEKATLTSAKNSLVRGACVDLTMMPEAEMEDVLNRLKKI